MTQQRTYPAGVTSWIDSRSRRRGRPVVLRRPARLDLPHRTPPGVPAYVIAQLDGQDVAGLGAAAATGHDPGPGTPTSRSTTSTRPSPRSRRRRAGDLPRTRGRGWRPAGVADPAGVPSGCGRRGSGWARRSPTLPAPGTSATCWTADPAAAKDSTDQVFGWEFGDLGFATMIRRPGYGDHLAATVDPGIHERQAGVGVPPGSPTPSAGWARRPGRAAPAGTSPSPSPTATRPRPVPSRSAARCSARTTPSGPSRR